MGKPVKWSSRAENDFAEILEYLNNHWNASVTSDFIKKVDKCIALIQQNTEQFPFLNEKFHIRKCVVTKHNSIFYRDTESRIEILRLYDTRQNPETLQL
jgi:plasmid stabilization system protein ParE